MKDNNILEVFEGNKKPFMRKTILHLQTKNHWQKSYLSEYQRYRKKGTIKVYNITLFANRLITYIFILESFYTIGWSRNNS